MPSGPKNQKINRHAQEAQVRDAQAASQEKKNAKKAEEDTYWADEGTKGQRAKDSRAAEAAAKAAATAARKVEDARLRAEEEASLAKAPPKKVLERMAQKALTKDIVQSSGVGAGSAGVILKHGSITKDDPLRDLNKRSANWEKDENTNDNDGGNARKNQSVEDGEKLTADMAKANVVENRKIGRRARVLYRDFCAKNRDKVAAGKKGLRRTQIDDLLWKMWQKHPSNPFVARAEAMAADHLAVEQYWMEQSDDSETEE